METEMKTMAKVVLDSVNPIGERLTTVEATYPRLSLEVGKTYLSRKGDEIVITGPYLEAKEDGSGYQFKGKQEGESDEDVCFYCADGSFWEDGSEDENDLIREVTPSSEKETQPAQSDLRLEKAVLYFSQEANCIDGGNPEEIRVRIEGSTGCDESAFAMIETDRWAVDIDELPSSIKAAVDRVLGRDK